MRRPLFALLLVALSATAASAQYRPRSSQRLVDALALPPRPAPGVAALVLEHAAELALADGQRVTVLSAAQQQRAAELENDARKQMDEERGRRGRDAGDGERRRGGGMDRPPEG